MFYELISDEEYQSLPQEIVQRFVAFESICRANMLKMIGEDHSSQFNSEVRLQYMITVSRAAEACMVPNLYFNLENEADFYNYFVGFCGRVQGEIASLRLSSGGDRHPDSVLLTSSTRTKIEHYVSRLREVINKSDIDLGRKKRLYEKLDQFGDQLKQERFSFAKAMGILAAVVATAGAAVTIAAEGPNAITHIMQLVGEDKASEEEALRRLTPPPKALPPPPAKPKPPSPSFDRRPVAKPDTFDDDIPF